MDDRITFLQNNMAGLINDELFKLRHESAKSDHQGLYYYYRNQGILSEDPIILQHSFPGLGDMLTMSTLPRIFASLGKDVYVSSQQQYRNAGIRDLFLTNPYIKGEIDKPGNCDPNIIFRYNPPSNDKVSYISKIEKSIFGVDINALPEIYYQPKMIDNFHDKTFVDVRCITHAWMHPQDRYVAYAREHFENCITVQDHPPADIFEYCDMIYSCKNFVCTYSGGCFVASALDRHNTYCLICEDFLRDVILNGGIHCRWAHWLPNINFVVADDGRSI